MSLVLKGTILNLELGVQKTWEGKSFVTDTATVHGENGKVYFLKNERDKRLPDGLKAGQKITCQVTYASEKGGIITVQGGVV